MTFLWGMPFAWRCNLGRWAKKDYVHRSWTFLTDPLTAWWIHAAAIWCWHAPLLFDLTLKSELAHTAQHLCFLLYARGRKAYGAGVFYIFSTAVHTGILGALLTFASHISYSAYATSTQIWGLTPLQDQQIGGLIMWVPASLIYLGAGLWLFAAWLKASDVMLQRTRGAE